MQYICMWCYVSAVTELHPKVGTRMLTGPIQASYAASRYISRGVPALRTRTKTVHKDVKQNEDSSCDVSYRALRAV